MAFNDENWLTSTLDCGDNSCYYRDRTKPSGMRTNGGCRCFSVLTSKKQLFVNKMLWTIKKQEEELEDLRGK